MLDYTHSFSKNFTEKVNRTQEVFYKSYLKKYSFVAFLDFLHSESNLEKFGLDRTHFFKVFGTGIKFENFKSRLIECGSFLSFRYYYRRDETKLHDANFCRADKLCSACAVRRAYKQQQKFLKAWGREKDLRSKNWYYIVIPVKHSFGEAIEVVYDRLDRVRKSILKAVRNSKSGRKAGFWGQFDGGMGSIEVTRTYNGWNVHLNLLVSTSSEIELKQIITKGRKGYKENYINEDLMKHLERVGDGSYVHNISKIDTSNEESLRASLVEVLKYSLKFSSLSVLDLIEVYMKLYRKRLFFTFGNMWGLKLDEVELEGDDVVDNEFIEVIYNRVFGGYAVFQRRFVCSDCDSFSLHSELVNVNEA